MTKEQIALARRAVACKGWRWMAGMLDTTGRRFICHADCGEAAWVWHADDGCEWLPVAERLPDLTDPATLGCLLALVREAWGDPYAFVGWFDPHWKVIRCRTESLIGCLAGRGDTEAEALVAALEAAPKRGEHRREE